MDGHLIVRKVSQHVPAEGHKARLVCTGECGHENAAFWLAKTCNLGVNEHSTGHTWIEASETIMPSVQECKLKCVRGD